MAGHDRDIYSSRQVQLPFPQFIVFYNGIEQQPERQIYHLHSAFPKGMNIGGAAIDCHAVVLNINYGHNRKIMQKCRKLEEYSIFIGKVREYIGRKMTIKDAIDRAAEECINIGIQEAERRFSLLTQYLQRDGRIQELMLLTDESIRRKLYKEYNLI